MNQPLLALTADRLDRAAEALAADGWVVLERVLPADLISDLVRELDHLEEAAALSPAGIGRGDDLLLTGAVRRDRIHWLTGKTPGEMAYLQIMEGVRRALNRRLFMGLFEFEAAFSVYEQGAFYDRHLDSFRGAANRIVSTVSYLNHGWVRADGGLLRLYGEDGHLKAEVLPDAGTLVLFLSEEIPHEVTPTIRKRQGIAGWFRLNASVGGAIDPPV